jgi:hypothetical protein
MKYSIKFEYTLETDTILPEVFFRGPGSQKVLDTVNFVSGLVGNEGTDKISFASIAMQDVTPTPYEAEDDEPIADGPDRDWDVGY